MDKFSNDFIQIGPMNFDFSSLASTHQEQINSWFLSIMPDEIVFPAQRNELGTKVLNYFDAWLLNQSPKKYSHDQYELAYLRGWVFYSSSNHRFVGQSAMLTFTKSDVRQTTRVNNGYRLTGGFWLYERKDGNPDRRYKDNYYTYYYLKRSLIIRVGSKNIISIMLEKDYDLTQWEYIEQQSLIHKKETIDSSVFKEYLPQIELKVLREKMIRYCKYPSWVPNLIKESGTYKPINSLWNPHFDEKMEAFRKSLIGNASMEYTPEEAFEFDSASQMIVGYDSEFGLSVAIPETIQGVQVKSIGAYAFYKKHLLFITFPETLEEIHEFALSNNHLKKLHLPNHIHILQPSAMNKNPLKMVSYSGKNEEIILAIQTSSVSANLTEEMNDSNS